MTLAEQNRDTISRISRVFELHSILREQRSCVSQLTVDPNSKGAKLGLSDWVAEEIILMGEEYESREI